LKKEKITKVFLCTEDKKYVDYFKKNLKYKMITFNSFRTDKIDMFNFYPRSKHRYNLGKEILLETLILSNCDILLYVNSNVISGSLYFSKKKQKKYEISLGYNPNNRFIARRLWFIKNLLPSFLGGFNNNIKLDKVLNKQLYKR